MVSDTSMLGADLPSLTTGLRGLAYWEIEITGPNRDLHSGHFGGAVANPINVLCGMLSKVIDTDGRITIPGFYDAVEEVPQAEREMIAHIPFNEEKYKEAIGVKELFGEKDTALSKETVAGLHSTFVVFGEVTPGKVLKLYSLPKPMPKYHAAWFPIKIIM